ncbi:cyclin protein [Ranunculus cassubicifolius]
MNVNNGINGTSLLEQDLFWEDEELISLFTKELEMEHLQLPKDSSSLSVARQEAVEWMLKVDAHYGFSPLTAVLAVNYLDRFMASVSFQRDKPWMTQLAAVACLSVAAKMEEIQVPPLLDLQVEETRPVFEAKTIMRMELLVLSTLDWRMNPVTPLSFLDHIVRRLGLKNSLHWEFMTKCERLLLAVIADSRSVCYLPSVLATATMLHDKLDECYGFILDSILGSNDRKRKYESEPSSPIGVIDASFSCDSSNDSWAVSSSVFSSPKCMFKKSRLQELQLPLPSFNHAALDVLITSPR